MDGERGVDREGKLVKKEKEKKTSLFSKKTKKREEAINIQHSWDSLVVTHPTTNQPACGLSTAEWTGSPVLHTLWSYVLDKTKQ